MIGPLRSYRLVAAILSASLLLLACHVARAQSEGPFTLVRTDKLGIESEELGRTYDVFVRLPPSYFEAGNDERLYPVLYVTDASVNFQLAVAVSLGPMNGGTIEDFIIVGLGYERGVSYRISRARDYTPVYDPEWEPETGEAEVHLAFIADDVIPFIESSYRADPHRRTLQGHSIGGLFATYALFARPDLFESYILSSPSLWYDDERIFEFEEAYAASHDDLDAMVYMTIGSLERPDRVGGSELRNHMVNQMLDMARRLEERGYPSLELHASVVDGLDHGTVQPTSMMNAILWRFVTNRDIPFKY